MLGLRENWLTMYWEALCLINNGEEYLTQLRRARRRAEAEGRDAEADCVLARLRRRPSRLMGGCGQAGHSL